MPVDEVDNSQPAERVHPLEAVPIVPDDVESGLDEANLVQLRKAIQLKRSWYKRLAQKFGYEHYRRLNLDRQGTWFWQMIDGRRTLAQIADALAEQFKLSQTEARSATVLFIKALMTREFIRLKLPKAGLEEQS